MAVNLFFIPHQDDEALTFGAAIRNHLDVGDECRVIIYTDGSTSNVRRQLNGEIKSALYRKTLNPAEEGYKPLQEQDMTAYRNDEFLRSCKALGVPDKHIHFSRHLVKDGTTTVESCEKVLQEFLERYPEARVKVFTDLGGNHRDHANMGTAGRNLLRSGAIRDLRLYVEPYNLRNAKKAGIPIHKEKSATHAEKVVDALKEYTKWNPALQQFAIGYHSVKKCFDAAMARPISYYHKP
ncbi:PIG-L family deacetylase [Paenibacillus sp. JX-17]|uniref:PIG-L family deacetylase n=1 Tax=Paenibacillus lacisoli TaxID=3064525 RepID=A0ABT9CGJ2_9BACL|nr:PIG-L family deacetylase [Paenibacillus sp. JX-17]MDO7908387.1 PIG-L family deacetylase [Paenibacillus sp. JX-17]